MRMRTTWFRVTVCAWLMLLAACSSATPVNNQGLPSTLRVGVIPNVSPERQRAAYEPFRQYLSDRLGVKVDLFVATNYAGVVAALVAGKVDVAYLGGLTYAQAAEQSKVTPLVTEVDRETGTPRYLSAIVVKADSPYQSLKDVLDAGGRFAFGDVSSTSGSLYPRIMLIDAGAKCATDDLSKCPPLKAVMFTGGHDATAQAVKSGSVDAGGIELRILHRLETQGSVAAGELRVIQTREVMGYPWVAREGLDDGARALIGDALLAMTDERLLDLMRAESYVKVTVADYAEVQDQARKLGLLTVRE